MRRAVLTLVLVLAPQLATAEAEADYVSDRIGHFEAGIACAQEAAGSEPAPGTVSGTVDIIEETPQFISTGRAVPAALGVSFGVIVGAESGIALDGVVVRLTHPPFPGRGATEQTYVTTMNPAEVPSAMFYGFDEPYELALGPWTFEAWHGGELLYRASFTVVAPETLPGLAAACGYSDLIGALIPTAAGTRPI